MGFLSAPSQPDGTRTTQEMALDGRRTRQEARTLLAIAQTATAGAGDAYPHSARIAAAFGRHAPKTLRATIGGAATVANEALHANAFVLGDHVAFARAPDLRLAAHEATHAVAQAHGHALKDRIGPPKIGGIVPKQGSGKWSMVSTIDNLGVEGFLRLGCTRGYIGLRWLLPCYSADEFSFVPEVPEGLGQSYRLSGTNWTCVWSP